MERNNIQTECLIPVPMHPKKLRTRGFNQAAVLTKVLAPYLIITFDLFSCTKVVNTLAQVGLNQEQRKKNLREAFTTTLPYKHITP